MDLLGATHALYGDCSQTPPSTDVYIGGILATSEQMTAITAKATELKAEWDANEYSRNRKAEYPTVAELTISLFDTDDKAALATKRAAVKTKWPKDNSGPIE